MDEVVRGEVAALSAAFCAAFCDTVCSRAILTGKLGPGRLFEEPTLEKSPPSKASEASGNESKKSPCLSTEPMLFRLAPAPVLASSEILPSSSSSDSFSFIALIDEAISFTEIIASFFFYSSFFPPFFLPAIRTKSSYS